MTFSFQFNIMEDRREQQDGDAAPRTGRAAGFGSTSNPGSSRDPRLDKRSNPLSQQLSKTSTGLSKALVVSIAKSSSFDAHVIVRIEDEELPWHTMPDAASCLAELNSSTTAGLTQTEAQRRLMAIGPNKLTPP